MSVKVILDSGGDTPPELARKYNLAIVPLKIRFGSEEFIDTVNLTTDQFWQKCQESEDFPQTAAPSSGDFQSSFLEAKQAGHDQVICITLSSELSATYQSATLAAREVANEIDVEVIDSRLATFAMGTLAINASIEAEKGADLKTIATLIKSQIPRMHAFGALDTLDNLRKGGRIGTAQALFGSLLSFKPIINVANGAIEAESKQRTRSKALAYLIEKTQSFGSITDLAVIHANAPDVDDFVNRIKSQTGIDQITIAKIGPVIGSHAGPRTMGVILRTLD